MTPAYIRWRCERIEQLLRFHSRKSALEIIAGEALEKPWESAHGQRQSLCPWVGRTA